MAANHQLHLPVDKPSHHEYEKYLPSVSQLSFQSWAGDREQANILFMEDVFTG